MKLKTVIDVIALDWGYDSKGVIVAFATTVLDVIASCRLVPVKFCIFDT